jgi:solute carrier family 35, member F5
VLNCTDVSIPVVKETKPLIYGITEMNDGVLKDKQLSTKEIATYGLYLCPLWFVTEVILQWLCMLICNSRGLEMFM